MKCAKSRKVKYSASWAGSSGTPASGCRPARSATIRGDAEPTWWTCSSALGRSAMNAVIASCGSGTANGGGAWWVTAPHSQTTGPVRAPRPGLTRRRPDQVHSVERRLRRVVRAAGRAGCRIERMATSEVTAAERARYRRWATDTWRSLDAMTDPGTGLPADQIDETLAPAARSGYTSPTNIGGYLWSTVVAHELRLDRPGRGARPGRPHPGHAGGTSPITGRAGCSTTGTASPTGPC